MELSEEDFRTLERAHEILENPGLAARLSNVIGAPIEAGVRQLPYAAQALIVSITRHSLRGGLQAIVATMDKEPGKPAAPAVYRFASGLSGAAGGFFGLAALPVELPVSTLLILRSIAEIARSEGEDLSDAEAQLACLEVLALGGRSRADDAAEVGYYATRIGLAQTISSAAQYITNHGFAHRLASPVAKVIAKVAARFSITITESMLAKAVPMVGAASGATINAIFMLHFQDMAWAHFSVRRLERKYRPDLVQQHYENLAAYNPFEVDPPRLSP
jgi:EcsC protein family